jgi:zinc transport system ATP-binding protein
MKPPLIEFEHVDFRYPDAPEDALSQVSFTISEGEYVGIVGPNGGGKTTILKLITALEEPDSGTVSLEGIPATQYRERSRIGYVPQHLSQAEFRFPATVREVVASGRTAGGMFRSPNAEDGRAVDDALKATGLAERADDDLRTLSGGQKQRAYIARALAARPKILILDEPTVGVDAETQSTFYTFLARLHKEHTLTILFVTHDLDTIAKQADHILSVNRTLICHTPSASFKKHEYISSVYGEHVKEVPHRHA